MRVVWTTLVTTAVTVGAVVATSLCFLFSPRGSLAARLVTPYWARAILRSGGLRVEVTGRERIHGGPFVVVCNHASALDICTCAAALPIDFRFVSRPFFFKVPFLGWAMWFARHISLDPRKPREAKTVLFGLGRRFGHGISVLLFPEGTRSPDGRLQRYRRGPFATAIENGVAVLPVYLHGLHERLPKNRYRMVPGRVPVVIGDPIPTTGLTASDARRLAEQVEAWTRAVAAEGGHRGSP